MVSKNPQKIGEANGMPSLPIVPTEVTKTGNVGSADVFSMPSLPILATQVVLRENMGSLHAPRAPKLFTFGPRGQSIALRGS